jgi:hypothetical protein
VVTVANGQLDRLNRFSGDLQRLARRFRSRLDPEGLCGEVDFAHQHSILTLELVEWLYQQYLGPGKSETHVAPLIEKAGAIVQWTDSPPEEIESKILDYTREVFNRMADLHIEELQKIYLGTVY